MNEVEKMYKNTDIKPKQKGYCDWDSNCPYPHHKCNDECPYWKYEDEAKYPPFTAEKQLELIKWLVHYIKQINITDAISGEFYFTAFGYVSYMKVDFDEALASFINNLWQDLTDAERKQIRGILESEARE